MDTYVIYKLLAVCEPIARKYDLEYEYNVEFKWEDAIYFVCYPREEMIRHLLSTTLHSMRYFRPKNVKRIEIRVPTPEFRGLGIFNCAVCDSKGPLVALANMSFEQDSDKEISFVDRTDNVYHLGEEGSDQTLLQCSMKINDNSDILVLYKEEWTPESTY